MDRNFDSNIRLRLFAFLFCFLAGRLVCAQEGDVLGMLEKEIAASTDPIEQEYLRLCVDSTKASAGKKAADLEECRERLLSFAQSHVDSVFGARALCNAADLENTGPGKYDSSLGLYAGAGAMFAAHPEWPGSEDYVPYAGIRIGDAHYNAGKYNEAASAWTETFKKSPNGSFSLQTLEKIGQAYSAFLPREEAWRRTHETISEFVPLVKGQPREGAVRIKKAFLLVDGYNNHLIPAEIAADEISTLLRDFPEGTNSFVDKARPMLKDQEQQLTQAAFAARRSDAGSLIKISDALRGTSMAKVNMPVGVEPAVPSAAAGSSTALPGQVTSSWRPGIIGIAIGALTLTLIAGLWVFSKCRGTSR